MNIGLNHLKKAPGGHGGELKYLRSYPTKEKAFNKIKKDLKGGVQFKVSFIYFFLFKFDLSYNTVICNEP